MYKDILKRLGSIYEGLGRIFSSDIRSLYIVSLLTFIVMSLGPIVIYVLSAISNQGPNVVFQYETWSVYQILIYLIPLVILYFLVKRKWLLCLLLLIPIPYYLYILKPLKDYALDDRFVLVSKSHRENANLYYEYIRGSGDGKQELINFENKCNPPAGCDCWIMRNKQATTYLKNTTGEWQVPYGNFILAFEEFKAYHLVSVKPINERTVSLIGNEYKFSQIGNEHTFSLIGCDLDYRLWWAH